MQQPRRTWQEELAIIDRTMKAISGVTDPEQLVNIYFDNIGDLLPIGDYVSVSRRNLTAPHYVITRSSRFTEDYNPWTQKSLLPHLAGGLLAELAYANKPIMIDDLPSRLAADDPAWFYLQGFQSLVSIPQYDDGESLNVTAMLMPPGVEIDRTMIPMLNWQAGLFGRGTQNLVLRNQLAAALAELDRELQTVGKIQKSLLPHTLPPIEGFELATFYQTSARAGGDYYDFFPLADAGWGLFIGDVSGHGTPAAVLMAITHAVAHAQPGTHTPPADLLKHLNQQLCRSYTRGGTFVTAFYAVLDPRTRTLRYSMAGHNPPRLVRDGRVISLEENRALPLGIIIEEEYGESTIALHPGDLLLLYTDGITEAAAPLRGATSRDLFGVNRLDRLLIECGARSAEECIGRVRNEVSAFCENVPQADDQTLIAIRCM